MIIGLGHKKGVGKDTIATYLNGYYSFRQRSFARKLKQSVSQLFGFHVDLLE